VTHDLDEALLSLDLILDEENDRLGTPGFDLLPPELVAAKMRMVGLIEAEQGRLLRDRAADRVRPGDADCERSAMLLAGVLDKLTLNATLLERRIALCDEPPGNRRRAAAGIGGCVPGAGGGSRRDARRGAHPRDRARRHPERDRFRAAAAGRGRRARRAGGGRGERA
jgi:hypothetical protein